MFCSACGKMLEEGKTFCKYCGARIPADTATTLVSPPPPTGWTPPSPPSPEWAVPPLPPPRSGSKTGLIAAIAVAAVLLVGGAAAAAFLLLAPKESEGEPTKTSGVVVATSNPSQTTAGTSSSTQTSGSGTTATVPGFDPNGPSTTQGPGTASTLDAAGYLQALDALETVLVHCDARIPILADQINNTAPGVPAPVSRELESLYGDIEETRSALGEFEAPPAYQKADQLLFEAADAQQYRIDQTMKGIDAMWNQGTVAAGKPYFDEGRKARDQYRTLFAQYSAAKPK